MNNLNLTALTDTFLKKQPIQSSELKDSDKIFVKTGTSYIVQSFTDIPRDAHSKIQIEEKEWYIYTPHWNIECKKSMGIIDWKNMNTQISKYFTLGEILRYDKARIPISNEIKTNILKLTQELDKIRDAWGSPIIITSGYRPPSVNARVGGARNSRHIFGDAADIAPTHNLKGFQIWLDERWFGALGYGAQKGFVHIDMRNGKGFNTGGTKGPRWNY